MPPKAQTTTPSTAATTSRSGGDTSIAHADSQVVTQGQLQEIVNHLQENNQLLSKKIDGMGMARVKLPSIKRFLGERSKLKGFLTQMNFKIT
jgi:hypothetical protein